VATLKAQNVPAYVYGDEKMLGGLNAFSLLVDKPEVYGLPADPKMPSRNLWPSSLFSIGSVGSFGSAASILSIGSTGSVLSIGSVGSILSIGSAGSVVSIGSAGRIAAIGQGPSTSGEPTVPRIDGTRDRYAAVGRTLALLALAAAALGR